MSAPPPVLDVRGLEAGYNDTPVVRDVSVTVPAASMVSIVGPNGAGKSTLLKAVYGLLRPSKGSVVLAGDGREQAIVGLPPHRLTRLGMNYVPQLDNVFPSMSVRENLEVGATTRAGGVSSSIYETFPTLRERRRQRAGTLSGGQRKLLALARALVTEPRLLLLDEPSAGLSPAAVDEVFDKLQELNGQGIAILMVEQNARRALALSHYGYVLDMGRNRYEGRGSELLADERVAELYLGRQRRT